MFRFVHLFLVVSIATALAACGGSGSSSSGGGDSSSGTFRGSETVRFTTPDAPGEVLLEETFPLTVDVRGKSVRVTNTDGDVFTGNLSGSAFTASGVIVLGNLGSGVVCGNANVTYEGDIEGGTIRGSMSTITTCTVFGSSVRIRMSGNFTVNRNARQAAAAGSMAGAIRAAAQRMR